MKDRRIEILKHVNDFRGKSVDDFSDALNLPVREGVTTTNEITQLINQGCIETNHNGPEGSIKSPIILRRTSEGDKMLESLQK